MQGRFIARATGKYNFGTSENERRTEFVVVEFEIVEGDHTGDRISWFGYFTPKTTERTVEALRIAGWQGDDMAELVGIGCRRVELVVEEEVYQGKTQSKVRWVNRPGGGGGTKLNAPMDEKARRAFSARMRGYAKAAPALPPETAAPKAELGGTRDGGASADRPFENEPPPRTDDDPIPF